MTWDIFCNVIDNFGDIGVTWRLARQLAREHGVAVRLWVDDLHAFQRLQPQLDPTLDMQRLHPSPEGTGVQVEIRRWTSPLPETEPGEVVIEALACNLPEPFIARMAARSPKPIWINLEYLTAETWADGVHGLPSPHPRLPLTKYFFVPGFSDKTGGLMREAGLLAARAAFQADTAAQTAFWRGLEVPPRSAGELRISLFAYDNAAVAGWLAALAGGATPVHLLVPQGKVLPDIAAWLGVDALAPGDGHTRGRLTVQVLPMLTLDDYDRLLWSCDLNCVRGEDSFVRAQFAARPLIWQAYRQAEDAHLSKLEAFLTRYCAAMPEDMAQATRMLWRAWNQAADAGAAWPAFVGRIDKLRRHAEAWCSELAREPDLAAKLMIFCEKHRKNG